MGYYTFFNLEIYESFEDMAAEKNCLNCSPIGSEVAKKLNKKLGNQYEEKDLEFDQDESPYFEGDVLNSVLFAEPYKWYEHEEDMCELSKEYPNLFFLLYGNGEESDDEWRMYVHNDNYYEALIFKTFIPPKKSDLI